MLQDNKLAYNVYVLFATLRKTSQRIVSSILFSWERKSASKAILDIQTSQPPSCTSKQMSKVRIKN